MDDYLGGNIEREQRDDDIEAALELATAGKVPENSEQAVFRIGKYSDEFWDEETRRMRSGRGLTTERELADTIFTSHKQAYRIRDLRTFHLFFMNRCAIRSHWFGMPEYIWDHPTHDPNADLILFMRSENGKPVAYDYMRHPLTHNSSAETGRPTIAEQIPKTGENRGDFRYQHLLWSPESSPGSETAKGSVRCISGLSEWVYSNVLFFLI